MNLFRENKREKRMHNRMNEVDAELNEWTIKTKPAQNKYYSNDVRLGFFFR